MAKNDQVNRKNWNWFCECGRQECALLAQHGFTLSHEEIGEMEKTGYSVIAHDCKFGPPAGSFFIRRCAGYDLFKKI